LFSTEFPSQHAIWRMTSVLTEIADAKALAARLKPRPPGEDDL
jgi:hypothetical protein